MLWTRPLADARLIHITREKLPPVLAAEAISRAVKSAKSENEPDFMQPPEGEPAWICGRTD